MSLISLIAEFRKAIQEGSPKKALYVAIQIQQALYDIFFGESVSALSTEDATEAKAELEAALVELNAPKAQVWGDGKILDFLTKILPIIIGLLPK